MEIMMMKRMNFIRSNLDQHNPRELTSKIRQDAKAKRDERILELWKKETDYPNVTELVQKLREEKQKQPRNDFAEGGEDGTILSITDGHQKESPRAIELQENSIFSTNNTHHQDKGSPGQSIMTGAETISN
jgi:hypothetical protein